MCFTFIFTVHILNLHFPLHHHNGIRDIFYICIYCFCLHKGVAIWKKWVKQEHFWSMLWHLLHKLDVIHVDYFLLFLQSSNVLGFVEIQTSEWYRHVRVKNYPAVNSMSIMLCKQQNCKSNEHVAAFAVRINNPCYEDKQNLLTITGFCTDHEEVNLWLTLACYRLAFLISIVWIAPILGEIGACKNSIRCFKLCLLPPLCSSRLVFSFNPAVCVTALANRSGDMPGWLRSWP